MSMIPGLFVTTVQYIVVQYIAVMMVHDLVILWLGTGEYVYTMESTEMDDLV